MQTFRPKDKIKRIKGSHGKVKKGDIVTFVSYKKYSSDLVIEEDGGEYGYDSSMFELVTPYTEPKGEGVVRVRVTTKGLTDFNKEYDVMQHPGSPHLWETADDNKYRIYKSDCEVIQPSAEKRRFKVGDKVKVLLEQYINHPVGTIGNVQQIDGDGDVWFDGNCYPAYKLQLVNNEASAQPDEIPFTDADYNTRQYNVYWKGKELIDEIFFASDGKIICKQGVDIYFEGREQLRLRRKQEIKYIGIDGDYTSPVFSTLTDYTKFNNLLKLTYTGTQLTNVEIVK